MSDEEEQDKTDRPRAEDPQSLSETERAILAFEHHRWKYAGAKETAVREQFDISMTRS